MVSRLLGFWLRAVGLLGVIVASALLARGVLLVTLKYRRGNLKVS